MAIGVKLGVMSGEEVPEDEDADWGELVRISVGVIFGMDEESENDGSSDEMLGVLEVVELGSLNSVPVDDMATIVLVATEMVGLFTLMELAARSSSLWL